MSTDTFLVGKVALVTGAGRGAGAAMARTLAGAGARVCVSDLNPDRADQIAGEIVAAGGDAFACQADISNKFQAASVIEATRDRFGGLHILAHHAHVSPNEPFLTMDEWEWRRTLEVNLTGAFFCAQLAARVMSDEGGGLIAIAVRPLEAIQAGQSAYAASQLGVIGLVGLLEIELARSKVRIETLPLGGPEETARLLLQLCQVE
jgi:NAD(P)-dependent dehydrogenase (short-subunit alcohol dehydrogenase family)